MKGSQPPKSEVFPGTICSFFYADKLCLGMVVSAEQSTCFIVTDSAEELTLSVNRLIILSHQAYVFTNPIQTISDFIAKTGKIKASINAEVVWYKLNHITDSMSIDDIASLIFLDNNDQTRFALFYLLRDFPCYFRQKGSLFYARTPDELQAYLKAEEEQKYKEKFYTDLGSWLKRFVQSQSSSAKAQKDEFLTEDNIAKVHQELAQIYQHKPSHQIKQICLDMLPAQTIKDLFVLIRRALGIVSADTPPLIAYSLLPDSFSEDIRQNALNIPEYMPYVSRWDKEVQECWTIDAESSQDLDDAISLKPLESGWLLGIHISDVSFFVKPGSVLDKEAFRRTSSIYLPDYDIHMIPPVISCDKASLKEGSIRPALSLLCTINQDYQITSTEIALTNIKINRRFTYDEIEQILSSKGATSFPQAQLLVHITNTHQRQRAQKITIPATESSLSPARKIIAELMIVYNSRLASFAKSKSLPFIYRYLDEQLQTQTAQTPLEQLIIPPSVISTKPRPHQALGLDAYAQVTSPLRRYADLLNQRQIISTLMNEPLLYTEMNFNNLIPHLINTRHMIIQLTHQAEQEQVLNHIKEHCLNQPLSATVLRRLKSRYILHITKLDYKVQAVLMDDVLPGTDIIIRISKVVLDKGIIETELD